jgi:hypothetical protein
MVTRADLCRPATPDPRRHVAEKSPVCRVAGSLEDRVKVLAKPMSSISSASSRINTVKPSSVASYAHVIERAARRGDHVGAAPQRRDLLAFRRGGTRADAAYCGPLPGIASSRVGTSTRPQVWRGEGLACPIRCSIGNANAAVLPVPVSPGQAGRGLRVRESPALHRRRPSTRAADVGELLAQSELEKVTAAASIHPTDHVTYS